MTIDRAVESARKAYSEVSDKGWLTCFACQGNPDNQYCATCENEGRLWASEAGDPLLAALAAAMPHLLAAQWRPIETAPKGGAEFLATSETMITRAGEKCVWHAVFNGDPWPESAVDGEPLCEATHWQPLPPPPTGESA